MDARTAGPGTLPLPAGWLPAEPVPPDDPDLPAAVVGLRVTAPDGAPAWLVTVTGQVPGAIRRRLKSEQPELDSLLHAVAAEPAGAVLLPWLAYGDPKGPRPYLACARPGTSFADDLARGPLPVADVARTALVCVDTLRLLHRHGRTHGQLAPDALHHDGTRVRLAPPLPPALAELIAAAGGTGHEPPEVLRGGESTAAADVFALASTAWTLLAGRPPFGTDQLARLTAVEPASLLRTDVPEAMESALRAALAVEPARRPDLDTVAQALQIVVDGVPAGTADHDRQDTLEPTRPVGEDTGQPLGSRYLLDALIGRGATGHVWRAHVRDDGTPVAVKLLRSDFAEDADVVTRFMRERTTLMRLHHPNLVGVRDLVAEGGTLAIVMDLVDGQDLRGKLGAGALPSAEAATLLAQVAAAVAAVHAAGIVHRDLKPENVLVEPDGTAKLTDFGLARAVEHTALTRTSQLVGTPAYLAPEIVAGRSPGPPVDVYALGVLGYELYAGRRPFSADSAAALLRAHLDEAPPRPDGLPGAVWDVLAACLAKDPQHRPSAEAVSDAWRRIAAGGEPGELPAAPVAAVETAPPPARHRAPVAAPHEVSSASGVLATSAAQRPLAPRHTAPSDPKRSRARMWWLIAAAVVVVAFGAGFAYVALSKSDDKAKHPAQTLNYPLTVRVTTQDGVPVVNWHAPAGVATDKSYVVLFHWKAGQVGKPITVSAIPYRNGKFDATSLNAHDCVVARVYATTKQAPASLQPKPDCVPATPKRSKRP